MFSIELEHVFKQRPHAASSHETLPLEHRRLPSEGMEFSMIWSLSDCASIAPIFYETIVEKIHDSTLIFPSTVTDCREAKSSARETQAEASMSQTSGGHGTICDAEPNTLPFYSGCGTMLVDVQPFCEQCVLSPLHNFGKTI